MRYFEHIAAAILVLASISIAVTFTIVASSRPLTSLEGTMLQGFSLAAGLFGSFLFGKIFARQAAREMIKPHARSAFRRLISLFRSLSRVAKIISETQEKETQEEHVIALRQLEAVVVEQLATADDAMEDWNDVVPEDVQELKKSLSEQAAKDVIRHE